MSTASYLWLGLTSLLLLLSGAAFVYLTLRRSLSRRTGQPLYEALQKLDGWLASRAPQLRQVLRRRLALHEWHGLALTLSAALFFALLCLFAVITEGWTSRDDLYRIDQAAHRMLEGITGDATVHFFRIVTLFGDGLTVLAIGLGIGALLLYRGDRWRLAALVVVVGAGQGVVLGLKWIFARTRPAGKLTEAGFYSFPSGHSFSATVLYGFLIFLTWRYAERDATRIAVTIALLLLIVLVGMSRVVLSVHWISDVLGGFTIGLAWLVCGITATRALQAYRAAGQVPHERQS